MRRENDCPWDRGGSGQDQHRHQPAAPDGLLAAVRRDRRACGEEAGKAVYQILSYAMMNLLVNTGLFCPLGVLFCIFLIPRKGYYGVMVTEPMTWVACGLFLTVVYFMSKNRRGDLPGGSDEKILRERGE